MYLLAPFILQNFKKVLRAHPQLRGCAIFGHKMTHLSWTKFFLVQFIIIAFIYLLALFTGQNLQKFLQRIQNYEDAPFLGKKWSICITKFFWKIINIILIYLLAPFTVQNFKKILTADPELWGSAILWAQNDPFPK